MELWSSCFVELSAELAEGPPRTLQSGGSCKLKGLMLRI